MHLTRKFTLKTYYYVDFYYFIVWLSIFVVWLKEVIARKETSEKEPAKKKRSKKKLPHVFKCFSR